MMDETTTNTLRLIITEILNDNHKGLQVLLDSLEKPEVINLLGYGGESPAHIAIYKDDEILLLQLLKAGADPHCRNKENDTLIHIAAKLGRLKLLNVLYDTHKCNLEVKDGAGRTPIDLLAMPLGDEVLVASRLYKNWSSDEPDDVVIIQAGRIACRSFLEEKVAYDRLMKIQTLTSETTKSTNERERIRRILNGEQGRYNVTYLDCVHFAEAEGKELVSRDDQQFYHNYRVGVHTTARTMTAHQLARNSLEVGFHLAQKKLT